MDQQETTTKETMRSRAAILPFPGDPFLLTYWLHFFDTVWGDEVDKLYIYLNSPIEPAVVDYIRQLCLARPKINLQYLPHMGDHGPAINRTLDILTEDLVMLVEDDGFIFKKGHVDWCFRQIEEGRYDIVGSKRGSCHPEILHAAQRKWGIAYEGEGDQGPNFWPNFFFTKKALLLSTNRNFAAKAWHKGETIEALDYIVLDDVIYGDTFVDASLQLRAIVPINRILTIPQYHGSPEDLDHSIQGKYLFDGQAPWTHIGSLSSGVGGVLRDQNNRHLDKRLTAEPESATHLPPQWCQTDQERREWERRVQWWLRFIEFYDNEYTGPKPETMADFANAYRLAVQQVINQYELSISNIHRRQKVYKLQLGL